MTPIRPSIAAAVAPAVPTPKDRATAQSFEAVFLGQMTQLMMDSVDTGSFSGGHGEEVFRGVLAEKLGTAMAARGGLGLAPAVLDQIMRLKQGTPDAS
ncbi:rod-binding protein [Sphingomonas sp. TREG-RG-20F-R18-01]|uniref:rod-binding protein n=1 Tax=Sphingomonas sp. TREG-RG-20F-R18-01 TaxID=2914982 RepID=UPI001F588303|nr:rod-binding protein [Sphingomonas sp. TREG-RG-20F-R18-01]